VEDGSHPGVDLCEGYLYVVIKASVSDLFIITAYFTDAIKRGMILWKKK
jgi:hypothetical protein